ncbi:uncharacterized protein LOC135844028 isoform X2 [Planococcus citri]|uniref:uncharacterized protein LOC135844028 isoform X2 n=1 Tax=Planococcus citri TaxID=170843 RepID=UPI0031F8EDAC
MTAAHLNLYQVCRLCLCELNGSSFVPIFDNKDSNLPYKIKSCFSISVDETDRLPNVLCPACTRDVERFYKFKEKVIKNNAFLKSYVFQRDRKAAQFLGRGKDEPNTTTIEPSTMKKRTTVGPATSVKQKRTPSKSAKSGDYPESATATSAAECLPTLNNYDSCEISNTFFDNSNKVKVEIIPQVDNDMYSSTSAIYSGDSKHNVVEMWPSSMSANEEGSSSNFRNGRNIEEIATTTIESSAKSPDYTSVIRHSSDDYGNSNSSYDKYISVHVKEEICKENSGEEYDSEDTKSAASLTFREEDEDKLIIDEETMQVKSYGREGVKTSDSCILLRTLISTSNAANQVAQSNQPVRSEAIKKPATFSPQILVSDMSANSPNSQNSPSGGSNTPTSEKSSTRRKQRCPTKSASEIALDAADDESDEDAAELAPLSEQQPQSIMYQQEIVNISPVTVTCTSNGREEIVGYSQSQFLDEVLSRHSSPATTPPMVMPSQAERLHKACDVLLRAASKIQDLPPGIQQEEVVVEEEESITLYPNSSQIEGQSEQITIRHNPVPLYEINFSSVNAISETRVTKKIKSREKIQNMSQHKECNNCHAVQTTIWRRDRFGNIVCNACGLYYKLHNYDRPCRMRRDEIHKRNRKRNANENKTKKTKRNSSGTFELNESSKEQENSSGSYTPPSNYNDNTNHITVSDLYHHPFGQIKKRRRTSAPGSSSATTTVVIKEEPETSQQEGTSDTEQTVEEISVNGNDIAVALNNHLYSQPAGEKLASSAFSLSTHFVPINGKVYEDFSNENSMSEAPLNLAAGSH